MNPLVKVAVALEAGKKRFVLFIGAGVSRDASLPTAWDVMLETARRIKSAEDGLAFAGTKDEIESWFKSSLYKDQTYSQLISSIFPTYPQQQEFLAALLSNREPGVAHRAIAELSERKSFRAIVTTNFDTLLEQALDERKVPYQVISNDQDLASSEPLIHCNVLRIYKPHGTIGKGQIRNSPKDLEKLSREFRRELVNVFSDHGVLTIGYSGSDPGMMSAIDLRRRNPYPFFWIDPKALNSSCGATIEKQSGEYIPCSGAGQFFADLLRMQVKIDSAFPVAEVGIGANEVMHKIVNGLPAAKAGLREYFNSAYKNFKKSVSEASPGLEVDEVTLKRIENFTTQEDELLEIQNLLAQHPQRMWMDELHRFYEQSLSLQFVPQGFSGSYRDIDFDAARFASRELLIAFTARMMEEQSWSELNSFLNRTYFLDQAMDREKTVSYSYLSRGPIQSLDHVRNTRLNLNLLTVAGGEHKRRLESGILKSGPRWQSFAEADYLLFLRSACARVRDAETFSSLWIPTTALYAERTAPAFIKRSASAEYFQGVIRGLGLEEFSKDLEKAKAIIKEASPIFTKIYNRGWVDDPLQWVKPENLAEYS